MTMQIWHTLADVPRNLGPTAVTLGNFDGVHRGHQAVLERMVTQAHAQGRKAVAVTFDPHPQVVHDPAHPPLLITGLEDRLDRLAQTGLDGVLVIDYTLEFAQQTPAEFVKTWLVDGLGAAVVTVGGDTRFGRGNAGDIDTMRELGEVFGFTVEVVSDAGATSVSGRRWSSTWVRELLEAGDLVAAAEVLGRPHRIRGRVVDGDKRGREIGFPTANLNVTGGMIPRHGVYAGWMSVLDPHGNDRSASLLGERLPAAISVGLNYTVGGEDVRVEGFAIGRHGLDLYGAELAFDLVKWRRPMLDFGSLAALTEALAEDVAWSKAVLQLD